MSTRFIPIIFFLLLSISLFPLAARAQTIGLSTAKKEVAVDQQVALNVFVVSPHQPINAVSGSLMFPATVKVAEIRKEGSIVDFWTEEPHAVGGMIRFEGIALNPGYQGASGPLFTVVFTGKKTGTANFYFSEASLLANDGFGSNIIGSLGSVAIRVTVPSDAIAALPSESAPSSAQRARALPVITDYSALVDPQGAAFVRGKGEPEALTKIVFKDASAKSVGEQFIAFLQPKKRMLDEVLVKNRTDGEFEYTSPNNLIAGAYNATPFLVDPDTQVEKPGLGVQLLVNDSGIVRILVVVINVLALLIPVVALIVIIYFIPWYSFRRMRILKRRMGLEEEKIALSSHDVSREDRAKEDRSVPPPAAPL